MSLGEGLEQLCCRRAVPQPVQDLLFCMVAIGVANHTAGPLKLGAQLIGTIVLAAALQLARSTANGATAAAAAVRA